MLIKQTLPGVSVMSASSPVVILVIICVSCDKLSDCSYAVQIYISRLIDDTSVSNHVKVDI